MTTTMSYDKKFKHKNRIFNVWSFGAGVHIRCGYETATLTAKTDADNSQKVWWQLETSLLNRGIYNLTYEDFKNALSKSITLMSNKIDELESERRKEKSLSSAQIALRDAENEVEKYLRHGK